MPQDTACLVSIKWDGKRSSYLVKDYEHAKRCVIDVIIRVGLDGLSPAHTDQLYKLLKEKKLDEFLLYYGDLAFRYARCPVEWCAKRELSVVPSTRKLALQFRRKLRGEDT